MKKEILIFVAALFFVITTKSQIWQENVKHNGYSCFMLKPANNITVYAAKGMEGACEALFIKVQVPYRWGNVSTAVANCFSENMVTGQKNSGSGYYHHYNGWMYLMEVFYSEWCGDQKRTNYPCYNYTFTLYEKNDHGRRPGNKTIVNLHLDKLNKSRMPMNKVSFETYW